MKPTVSLIISTFNRKKLISKAIESGLSQKNVALEIIVIDDDSIDGTFEYLKGKYQYESKVKVLRTKLNSGVASATNLGFQHSKGDYIALLGDDDYWIDANKLSKQISIMKNDSQIGVCGTWWVELGEYDRNLKKTPTLPNNRYKLIERTLIRGGLIGGSTSLISRTAWIAVGGMDEEQTRGTDSDLFRRIILHGYNVNVLHEVSTYVDIAHGMTRMTSMNDLTSLRRHLKAQCSVLKKHLFVYFLYPRALFARLFSILRYQVTIWSKQFFL